MTDSRLCILVVGMHRSGTSAVTRVINLLGAGIARDLTPAQAGNNERGFWESEAIITIHNELLAALGAAWDYSFQLPENWLQSNVAREAKRKLAERIRNDFADSRTLVVKDPRMARLLPLWLELLGELQIEPLLVIPFRNPLEVAASLEKRDAFSLQKSLLLYLWSYLGVEAASRGRPRLFIGYASLLADWRSFAARILALSGGRLSKSENASNEIEAFLTTELHHNRSNDQALAARLGKQSPVLDVFDRMREVESMGEQPALSLSFDRLHMSVAPVADLFRGFVPYDRHLFEIKRIENESRAVRQVLAVSEEKRSAHAAELIRTWARIVDLEKLYTARTDELILTRDHVLLLENQVLLLQKANAEMQAAFEGSLTLLRTELSESQNRCDSQAAELFALKSSTIWQMTRPVRQFVEAYRRLFGLANRG